MKDEGAGVRDAVLYTSTSLRKGSSTYRRLRASSSARSDKAVVWLMTVPKVALRHGAAQRMKTSGARNNDINDPVFC